MLLRLLRCCGARIPAVALLIAAGLNLATRWRVDVGVAFTSDSLRDYAGAAMILRGALPMEGPAVGKLGFSLGLLYYHLLALILSVQRSLESLVFATRAFEAGSLALLGLLVARLSSANAGAFAVLLAVANSTLHDGSYTWFVHPVFAPFFELLAVLAMTEAYVRDRPERLALAVGFISAATQFHASVLPMFALPLLLAPMLRRDASAPSVPLAWLLLLAPFMPFVGEPRFLDAARSSVPGALAQWLFEQTLLIPSLLYVWISLRPRAIVRALRFGGREGRAVALLIGGGALLYLVAAARRRGAPTLKLMNLELHAPRVPQGEGGAAMGFSRMLEAMFHTFSPTLTAITAAALAVGVLAAAWRAWRDPAGSEARRASVFLLTWCGVMFFACGFMYSRVHFSAPHYLTHAILAIVALAGWGAHQLFAGLDARRPWRSRGGAKQAISDGAGWALVLVCAALVGTLRMPPGAGVSSSLTYDKVAIRVWRTFFDELGLGDAVQTHLHGSDGTNAIGEIYSTPWAILVDGRRPQSPRAGTDPRVHYRIRAVVETEPLRAGERRVGGTLIAWTPYRAALRGDRAMVVSSLDARPRALPLPYRHDGRAADFRATPFRGSAPLLVPLPHTAADIVLTVPRDASTDPSLDGISVLDMSPGQGRGPGGGEPSCVVDASLGGVPLASASEGGSTAPWSFAVSARESRFVVPPGAGPSTLVVRLRGCNPWYLDVFDVSLGARSGRGR